MKRYALLGTGSRGYGMYARSIVGDFSDAALLVGLCDPNPLRSAFVRDQLSPDIPTFERLEDMVAATRPDTVIITTVDCHHAACIRRAFALGCDVICEKPLATEAAMCRDILAAEEEFGRKVTVTFNMRFVPYLERLKALLLEGIAGDILHVNFEWLLDTSHGADYFRRWHRSMGSSGGLLVHKATHHFDVVNWLIGQDPVTVAANGTLGFYGQGEPGAGPRCTDCGRRSACALAYPDSDDPTIRGLYFDAEGSDGYYRDRCVFSESIDIYDSMSLAVRYGGGALLTYSLVAHSPYEGWRMSISGTQGRLEAQAYSSGHLSQTGEDVIRFYDRFGGRTEAVVPRMTGGHGGSDVKMLAMLFRGGMADPLDQQAGSRAGVLAAMIGISANASIREQRIVTVADLLGRPV